MVRSIELKKEDNNSYTAYLEKLPKEDFFFTIYPKEKVTLLDSVEGHLNRSFGYFAPIVIVFVILVFAIFVIGIIRVYKSKNGN